jgi:cellulose synthase/poly-beta-1,6-N-acetylglucosamine synthase-like glycosyltransferase
MTLLFLILYIIPLAFIFSYSLVQLSLILSYKKRFSGFWSLTDRFESKPQRLPNEDYQRLDTNQKLPRVTIQLPIYNERYVIERLIAAVAQFEYPKELFEIQILDDSTDETTQIIAQKINQSDLQSLDIQHIRRDSRIGFKAGALAYGLTIAKGEFIAIFDADFIPQKDFLQKTIPYFEDSNVGVVQTRWEHLNKDFSLLTQLQAFGLDAHFTIEQSGRNAAGHFINFNGTAGIWRREAIESAGGWQADTITEDLDLSYRSQLKGWQFVYLEEVSSPAELPVAMNAIKSQQYRWSKGAAECMLKNIDRLFKSPNFGFSTKLHGFYHLMNSATYVFLIWIAVLSIPVLLITSKSGNYFDFFRFTAVFQVSWVILGIFYWIAFRKTERSIFSFGIRFFLFLCFMMGLSVHNSIAVIEGWMGRKTPFIRTPKFNITQKTDTWQSNIYLSRSLSFSTWLEILLLIYCLIGLFLQFYLHNFGMTLFYSMMILGLSCIVFYTIKHTYGK